MSDSSRDDPNSVEQQCYSVTSNRIQPNATVTQTRTNNVVKNEMPLLVYSYLKSVGFDGIADEFLSQNVTSKYPIKKYNLCGQPIVMSLDECKVLADSVEPNRLTDIVDSMKRFVENAHQTNNVEGASANNCCKQTYSLSLITPAQQELNKFMDPVNIRNGCVTSCSDSSLKNKTNLAPKPNLARLLANQKFTGQCNVKKLYSTGEPFQNLRLMKRVLGHISAIYCFTLDRTKCTLFTGGEDGLVKIWNLEKCVLVATLRGHVKAVNDLSINHQNNRLASCGVDSTIRIWCLQNCALLYTLRNGHNCPVMSVCFSPYPVGRYRYLISTGQNGTLCFYKIDNDDQINPTPIKFAEKQPNKHFRINCFTVSPGGTYVALGVTDPTIRVYKMGIKGPVRTMELYGHSDEVESVEFDNYGSRFCSGSKDGTVCIWTLSITSWKCAQINVKNDMITAVKNKSSGPGSKKKNNFTINLVSWSCDNKRICCACADFVIRTYDSCSRDIVSRLSVHADKVTVLHHHPTVGNLLLSSGCDGKIYLWNTDTGTLMVCLENNLGEQGFGSVYDLAFISNGRDFVMCDYHGNWAIYSSLPNQTLDQIPSNQFFHSDYWEIREDPLTGKVVDVLSLLEPHVMPPPVMVNYFGIPYNNDVQKLIPGAALLNKETEFNYNHINLHIDSSVSGPGLATSGSVEGVRKTGIINKKNRSHLNCSYLMWFRRHIVNKLTKMDISDDFEVRLQIYKHEQSIYNNMRHRASEFYDKEERVGRLLHLQSIQKERQLEKQARRVVALPISNSGDDAQPPLNNSNEASTNNDTLDYVATTYNHTSVNDHNTSEYDESFQYFTAVQSERNSDPEFIDESDEFLLEEDLPTRSNRSARLRSLRPRNSTGSTIPNRRRGIATRSNGPLGEETTTLQDNVDILEEIVVPPVPEDYPSSWVSSDLPKISPYVPQLGDQVYYFIQGHRFYLQELFRQNLINLLPSVNAYEEYDRFIVPEVNSHGYELCRVVDIQYIYKNPLVCKVKLKRLQMERYSKSLEKFDNAYKRDFFVLEFHDMQNILDFIVLREVVDLALKREWSSGDRFRSIIEDCWWYGSVESCSGVDSEFPQSPHLSYVVHWDTGEYDRISPWDMECIDSNGSIFNDEDRRSLTNYDTLVDDGDDNDNDENGEIADPMDNTTSRLILDNGSTESVVPFNCGNNVTTGANGESIIYSQQLVINPVPIDQDEFRTLCERYIYQAHTDDETVWGGEDPFVACERIADAIENFKNHYIAYAFSMPVDLVTFADYWTIVPHPMDLRKVVSRLRNHYYRSKEAIMFDIKLIKLNALSYNRVGTPISHCASTLYTLIEELTKNSYQIEIDLKNPLLAGKRYPVDVSGPSTVKSTKRRRNKKLVRFNNYSDESDDEQQFTRYSKLGSNEMMVEWINDAFDLLNYLMNLKDSECFLNPVDLDEYPEYTQFVRFPMDFNTVLNKLKSGIYIHPVDMIDDIKLIFSNSRAFNTNPRSKIYSMTARLSNQFRVRSESFLKDWANIAPLKRPLTRSIIRNIYNNYLATQNQTVDSSSLPTSSRRAYQMGAHSSESDRSRSQHRYSLRKSEVVRASTRSRSTHRFVSRYSSSSYSPSKVLDTHNEDEYDEQYNRSNYSSYDEISTGKSENSYLHNKHSNRIVNKKTRSAYKVYEDVELAASSTSSISSKSKNKT